MTQNTMLTLLSVPYGKAKVYALVPGDQDEALARVRRDDALWNSPRVWKHWTMAVNVDAARVRPDSRARFWLG